MAKQRTINEYRQTKEFYRPPVSHEATEKIEYRFTKTQLVNYIGKFVLDAFFDDGDTISNTLKESIENHISNTIQDKNII
tara:strand:- start:114 stop:353 length:240 start_codon:yes stop_codon:yes gene_type:complete